MINELESPFMCLLVIGYPVDLALYIEKTHFSTLIVEERCFAQIPIYQASAPMPPDAVSDNC